MYAIVDIAGQQFKVEKDKTVFVHRLDGKIGSKVELNQVLLIDNEKDVAVGSPVISGALVTAEILEHVKGDKVIVFKKKRRKGYKKKNGHRQLLTKIHIKDISEKGAESKIAAKKDEKKEEVSQKASASPSKEKKASTPSETGSSTAKESTGKKAQNSESKQSTGKKTKSAKKTESAKKPSSEKKSSEKKENKKED